MDPQPLAAPMVAAAGVEVVTRVQQAPRERPVLRARTRGRARVRAVRARDWLQVRRARYRTAVLYAGMCGFATAAAYVTFGVGAGLLGAAGSCLFLEVMGDDGGGATP